MRVKERLRSSVCARARECAPRSAHHHSHHHYSHSRARARTYTSSLYSRRPLSRRGSIIALTEDRERGLTASEEQRRAKGTGRERRILEERGAEYAEKLEEKAVIVAMARRVEGGNCSRRRMTIPLSPAYRMSEKDKEREEFSRLAARARRKERAKGCSRGQEHKVTTREETRRRNEKQDTGRGLKVSHQACRRRRRADYSWSLSLSRETKTR